MCTLIQGYRDIGIQEYRDTGIQGYRDTGIQGYRDTGIQEYMDTRMFNRTCFYKYPSTRTAPKLAPYLGAQLVRAK